MMSTFNSPEKLGGPVGPGGPGGFQTFQNIGWSQKDYQRQQVQELTQTAFFPRKRNDMLVLQDSFKDHIGKP